MSLAKRLGRLWQDDEETGRNLAVRRGNAIFPLPEPERERWKSATRPVIDAWLEKVCAMGHDGEAMLADARRLVAKYVNER